MKDHCNLIGRQTAFLTCVTDVNSQFNDYLLLIQSRNQFVIKIETYF